MKKFILACLCLLLAVGESAGGTLPADAEASFSWNTTSDTPDYSLSGLGVHGYTNGAALSTELGVPSLKVPATAYALAEFNSAPTPPYATPNPDYDFNEGTAEFEIYFDLQFYIAAPGTGASDGTWAVADGFGGTGARGTFTTTNGAITGITVTDPGRGYQSNGTALPTVVATSGSLGTGAIGTRLPDSMWLRLGNEVTNDAAITVQARAPWQNQIRVVRGNASSLNTGILTDTLTSGAYALTTGAWHRVVVKWRTSQAPYLSVNVDGGTPSAYTALPSGDTLTAADAAGDLLLTHTKDFKDYTKVRFTTTGALPGGLAVDTDYWLVKQSATTSKVATSLANAQGGVVLPYASAGAGTARMGTTIDAVETQVLVGNDTGAARSYHLRNLKLWRTWRDDVGGGTASGGTTSPVPDTTALRVVGVTPADKATDVALTASVVVDFSGPIDCATVTASSFTVAAGAAVVGMRECAGSRLTFTPAAGLAPATAYTVTLSSAVKDAAGNALAAFTAAFTTANSPPLATYSVGGSVAGLGSGEQVVLQLNGIDTLTVTANDTFTFAQPLAGGRAFTVTVLTPPAGQTCAVVTRDVGTVGSANIIDVGIQCAAAEFEGRIGCNCGATDARRPCIGNVIAATVKARPRTTYHVYTDAEFRWDFHSGGGSAYCGQFANGDYWVAPKDSPSVTITNLSGNGKVAADANPIMEALGLLDQSGLAVSYGNYTPDNNIVPRLPVTYSDVTSLVAAKQRDEVKDSVCGTKAIIGACVDAYHVVTVLPSVPANAGADMIRPNISGKTKTFLTLDDFDFSRLPNSAVLKGTDAAGLEKIRQRWSHSTEAFGLRTYVDGVGRGPYSEGGRAFRAGILYPDYGSAMAQAFNVDLMTIFSDDNTFEEKRKALAAMLAYGLDIYHARYDAPDGRIRGWVSGAGQSNGKFLPPVILAALLKDPAYANVLRTVGPNTHAANEADRGPAELRQIHTRCHDYDGNGCDAGEVVHIWGDEPNLSGSLFEGAYWGSMLKSQCFDGAAPEGTWPGYEKCNISFGAKTQVDPYGYIDGPPNLSGSAYMTITAGIQRAIVASMFLMPEVCSIVNAPELVSYVDRLNDVGAQVTPDLCAPPDPRENPATCDAYRNKNCQFYGVTWGPVDPSVSGSGCIKGGGRFTSRQGQPFDPNYITPQVESNWTALRGSNPSCMP